jgi:hypothetical protein
MDTLQVINLHQIDYESTPKRFRYTDLSGLSQFSHEITFGKSYLLHAKPNRGAWGLSWLISGIVKPWVGQILLNGKDYPAEQRRQDSWCVRYEEIKRWGWLRQSVHAQIQYALKHNPNPILKTEQEIIQHFWLTPERLPRYLTQYSHEGWRASCAIGFALGKKIFCFPYLDYLSRDFKDLWLKDMLDFLTSHGALVLVPAFYDWETVGLCDEVVWHVDYYQREEYREQMREYRQSEHYRSIKKG